MEHAFETIINSYLENNVGLKNDFLNDTLSTNLKENLLHLLANEQMKAASIGSQSNLTTNKLIRSDIIYWLDRKHNNIHENSFFDLIDNFIIYLNRTCFTGITSYEFHYAYYDKGSSYKRHLDQFKCNKDRAFSMIMYLNSDWIPADGGQLCIYNLGDTQIISPTNGKCVFFKSSELEHEVLLSFKPRMSITGWLKTN